MSVNDMRGRDQELADSTASVMQDTLGAISAATGEDHRSEAVQELSSALRDQAAAYRELREIMKA